MHGHEHGTSSQATARRETPFRCCLREAVHARTEKKRVLTGNVRRRPPCSPSPTRYLPSIPSDQVYAVSGAYPRGPTRFLPRQAPVGSWLGHSALMSVTFGVFPSSAVFSNTSPSISSPPKISYPRIFATVNICRRAEVHKYVPR